MYGALGKNTSHKSMRKIMAGLFLMFFTNTIEAANQGTKAKKRFHSMKEKNFCPVYIILPQINMADKTEIISKANVVLYLNIFLK